MMDVGCYNTMPGYENSGVKKTGKRTCRVQIIAVKSAKVIVDKH